MTTRLSRKAQECASELVGRMDQEIRSIASRSAEVQGKEFADEGDVIAAFKRVIGMTLEAILPPS